MRHTPVFFLLFLFLPSIAMGQEERPLILIHGFFTKSFGNGLCWSDANETKLDSWASFQSKLVQDGLYSNGGVISENRKSCPDLRGKQPVYRFTYYKTCYDSGDAIKTYTERLSEAITFARNCSGSPEVDVVAHSLGGLITKNYMETVMQDDIGKVVFMATPHEGVSPITIFLALPICLLGKTTGLCPPEALELMKGSSFIKNTSATKMFSSGIFTIKSDKDLYIPKDGPDHVKANLTFKVSCAHDDLFRPRECPKGYDAVVKSLRS